MAVWLGGRSDREVKNSNGHIVIKPTCSLDARIFVQPITIVVEGESPLQVIQDGKELKVSRRDDNFLIDINPHGGEIIVY